MSPRQRRGLVVLAIAVAGAVVTFLAVLGYTQRVGAQLGPLQDVVVVTQDIAAHSAIDPEQVGTVQVPVVFAPPGALTSIEEVGERVTPLPLPAGTYLQDASLQEPPDLVFGERAVTLAVDGESSLGYTIEVGDVVDVVAATEQEPQPVSAVAVDAARVVGVRDPDPEQPGQLATLALSRDEVLALARARAGADVVLVVRLSPAEAGQ